MNVRRRFPQWLYQVEQNLCTKYNNNNNNNTIERYRQSITNHNLNECHWFSTNTKKKKQQQKQQSKEKEFEYDNDTGIVTYYNNDSISPILFQTVIGLEIHAQLWISSKLFSTAPTTASSSSSGKSNERVSLMDMAYPGSLPRLSKEAVRAAITSARALNCESIHKVSRFERKHYAYADLPCGYQMTQQRWPIATQGHIAISPPNNYNNDESIVVGIDRIQLEQDTGNFSSNGGMNLNRAGSALIEIVFTPFLGSGNSAANVVSTIQQILRYVGTCDGKLQDGSLRADVNVSIAPLLNSSNQNETNQHAFHNNNNNIPSVEDNPFEKYLPPNTGHRVEVKNLNSYKQIMDATKYEAIRQTKLLCSPQPQPTSRETRTFLPKEGRTHLIRSKGDAIDYRFLPEPDLPPLILGPEILYGKTLEEYLATTPLPELPQEVTHRLMEEYNLSEDVALVLTSSHPKVVQFYEETVHFTTQQQNTKDNDKINNISLMVANWLCNDVIALMKEHNDSDCPRITPTQLGSLIVMILEEVVSTTMAKNILQLLYIGDTHQTPAQIAAEKGWKLITDTSELETLCNEIIVQHPKQLDQFRQGGKYIRKMEKFFLGKVMAHTRGNAHPQKLKNALLKVLNEVESNEN